MNTELTKIFHHLNLAGFRFNADFQIIQKNPEAEAWLQRFGNPHSTSLLKNFPELFGMEEEIGRIVRGEQEVLRLEYVNRLSPEGGIHYFHLNIFQEAGGETGLLVLEDVTSAGQRLQFARQSEYRLLLQRQSSEFRRMFIQEGILGDSPLMEEVRETVRRLQHATNTTILLQGESGTGKNLVARVIHYSSMPPDAPFVEINCAALPENLLESELFGYEKGAFTHAHTSRVGLLEEAHGGTIFLDEIGELSLALQAKLLSVLESRKFRRLGSNKLIETSARFIVATNRDLRQAVAEKRFREDLYYRLNVVVIHMPPLRALGDDILLLAHHFLKIFNAELKKRIKGFTRSAQQAMLQYSWPGNVRELSNTIERAVIFCDRDYIDSSDLILQPPTQQSATTLYEVPPGGIRLEEVERQLILSALKQSGGNKTRAAQLLGLSRDTLRYRLSKYGLEEK